MHARARKHGSDSLCLAGDSRRSNENGDAQGKRFQCAHVATRRASARLTQDCACVLRTGKENSDGSDYSPWDSEDLEESAAFNSPHAKATSNGLFVGKGLLRRTAPGRKGEKPKTGGFQ